MLTPTFAVNWCLDSIEIIENGLSLIVSGNIVVVPAPEYPLQVNSKSRNLTNSFGYLKLWSVSVVICISPDTLSYVAVLIANDAPVVGIPMNPLIDLPAPIKGLIIAPWSGAIPIPPVEATDTSIPPLGSLFAFGSEVFWTIVPVDPSALTVVIPVKTAVVIPVCPAPVWIKL